MGAYLVIFDLYMNHSEILNLKEQAENEERKRELIKLIRSGEALLIVGAGSSRRVGYLDWPGLLTELEVLASGYGDGFKPDKKKLKDKPLEYAEDIKSYISKQIGDLSDYYALLEQSFGVKDFLPDALHFHKTLVALPFKGILTTNYDVVLEEALKAIGQSSAYENSFIVNKDAAGQVHRFFFTMNAADEQAVAHLHGKYDDPRNIILSNEDYERAYNGFVASKEASGSESSLEFFLSSFPFFKFRSVNQERRDFGWTLHRKLLWAILATRQVVFLGFSMKDPYFKRMLETVAKDLWRGNKSVHFAIRDISPEQDEAVKAREEAEELKGSCGVETLFYEDTNGRHEGLWDIVDEIAGECGVEVSSTVLPQDPLGANDCVESKQPESIESELRDELDQLRRMNRRMTRRFG